MIFPAYVSLCGREFYYACSRDCRLIQRYFVELQGFGEFGLRPLFNIGGAGMIADCSAEFFQRGALNGTAE